MNKLSTELCKECESPVGANPLGINASAYRSRELDPNGGDLLSLEGHYTICLRHFDEIKEHLSALTNLPLGPVFSLSRLVDIYSTEDARVVPHRERLHIFGYLTWQQMQEHLPTISRDFLEKLYPDFRRRFFGDVK